MSSETRRDDLGCRYDDLSRRHDGLVIRGEE